MSPDPPFSSSEGASTSAGSSSTSTPSRLREENEFHQRHQNSQNNHDREPLLGGNKGDVRQRSPWSGDSPAVGMYGPNGKVDTHNRCCDAKYWCIKDCCGMVCAFFTWLLILYAEFVVTRVILIPDFPSFFSILNFIVFQSLVVLAVSSHVRTMITDPGAVPRGNATKENIEKMGFREGQVIFKCPKCCSIKPDRAHHCSICQRCIRKMDHHCPWVNNCVGENNQKFFVLFTFYIAVMSIHALGMAITHFVSCLGSEWHGCPAYSPPATIIFLLFLIFEGLLFALFTAIMFGTQVSAIWYDETGIESLKKEEARWVRKSRWKSMQVVFGKFSIHWFSPFTTTARPTKTHGYLFSV